MRGLIYEGHRCPEGVELHDYGPMTQPVPDRGAASDLFQKTGQYFRYITPARVPVRMDIRDLITPVACDFINARTDQKRRVFFSRYGLPAGRKDDEFLAATVTKNQTILERVLADAAGGDAVRAVKALNEQLDIIDEWDGSRHRRLSPIMTLDESGVPTAFVAASTLHSFMLMECVMAAEVRARLTACERCNSVFLTGPLTARRSSAKFCSDRCRVAAMRARNSLKEG